MGHLKIHCDGCGSDWIVYHRDDWKDWKARTCPVCGKSIEPGTWEKSVLRAFGEMEDANLELSKDHAQYDGALFTVSYIPDVIFPNKDEELDRLRAETDDLMEAVESLQSMIVDLVKGGLYGVAD